MGGDSRINMRRPAKFIEGSYLESEVGMLDM